MKTFSPRLTRPLILALPLLPLLACAPAAPPSPAAGAGCADGRWVAVKDPAEPTCPDPADAGGSPDWRAAPLFAAASGGSIPPDLAGFCLYEHAGAGNAADLPELIRRGRLLSASRDCLAVAPAGPLTDSTCEAFHGEFLDRVGLEGPLDFGPPTVRLALLDTLPTIDQGSPADAPSNSLHGTALAHLVDELVCSGEDACAARATSRLAMSCIGLDGEGKCDADLELGGYFGTVGELAAAIFAELDAWRTQAGARPPELILNLSLGWDAAVDVPDAAAAVRQALEEAVCAGALVVAAAGNPAGGATPSGALLPAAWETLPVPACAAGPGYRPLVHAVGGVRFDGRPLARTRPASLPRLVAFADHWAITAPPAALTGTSVATASMSSIAAAVWHSQPQLLAHEVMQRIYDRGLPTGGLTAELGDQGEPVRRASLCHALHAGCPGEGCPCTAPQELSLDIAAAGALNFEDAPAPQLRDASLLSSVEPQALEGPNQSCPVAEILYPGEVPELACPFEQLPGVLLTPHTWPHPGDDPCPTCGMFPEDEGQGFRALGACAAGTYRLLIEIDGDFPGTLSSPTLTLGSRSYSLGLTPMQAGDRAVIRCLPLDDPADLDRLDLTWAVELDGGQPQLSTITYPAMTSKPPEGWQLP